MVLPSLVLALAAASSQWLFASATQDIVVPFDQLAYTMGNWSRYSDLSPINCTGGAAISFGVAGALATYTFKGIAVALSVITANDGSTADITLDGETTQVSTLSTNIRCEVEIFKRTGLDWNTQHVLSVRSTQANSLGVRGLVYTTLTQSEQMSLSAAGASSTSAYGTSTRSTGSPTGTSQPSDSGSSNTAAIVGGVVGGIAGIGIIVALIFFLLRRKKHKNPNTSEVRGDHALHYGQPVIEPQHTSPPMMQQQQQQPYLGPQQFPPNQPTYQAPMHSGGDPTWPQQQQQQLYPQQQPYPQQQYPQQQFAQQSFAQQGYPQSAGYPITPPAQPYSPPPPPLPGTVESMAMGYAYPQSSSPAPSAGASTSVPSSAPPPSDVKSPHGPPPAPGPEAYADPAPAYDAGPGR